MATKTHFAWKAAKIGKPVDDRRLRDKQRLVKAEKALLVAGVKQDERGEWRHLSTSKTPFLRIVLTAEQCPRLAKAGPFDAYLWFDIYSSMAQRSQPGGGLKSDRFYIAPTHGTPIDDALVWAEQIAQGLAFLQQTFNEIA